MSSRSNNVNPTLGVIGTGSFASYLLHGFMKAIPDLTVVLSPRNRHHAEKLREQYGHVVADSNQGVVELSDIVLASTLPSQLHEALGDLPWSKEQTVVCVAAGIKLEELTSLVQPASAVLCMPTNAAMIGTSIVPMFPENAAAENFLKALGNPIVLPDETSFESCAVLGATYGWLLGLNATLVNWLEQRDVPASISRALIAELMQSVGSISLDRSDKTVEDLVNELRLPGGLTEHGLDLFDRKGSYKDWEDVLENVLARLHKRY